MKEKQLARFLAAHLRAKFNTIEEMPISATGFFALQRGDFRISFLRLKKLKAALGIKSIVVII